MRLPAWLNITFNHFYSTMIQVEGIKIRKQEKKSTRFNQELIQGYQGGWLQLETNLMKTLQQNGLRAHLIVQLWKPSLEISSEEQLNLSQLFLGRTRQTFKMKYSKVAEANTGSLKIKYVNFKGNRWIDNGEKKSGRINYS